MKYYNPYYSFTNSDDGFYDNFNQTTEPESDYCTDLYIKNLSEPKKHHHPSKSCLNPKEDILRSQACVAKCEAELFCEIIHRLCCEIRMTHSIACVDYIVDIASKLLKASACKEEALAKVIKACAEKYEIDCGC